MRALIVVLLLGCFALTACSTQTGQAEGVPDQDIAQPELWVSRIFSRIDEDKTLPAKPVAGEVIRAMVSTPDGGAPFKVFWRGDKLGQSTRVESSPASGTVVVAFDVPKNLSPGSYELRLASGKQSSSWLDFEVTTEDLYQQRQHMSAMAHSLPEASHDDITLLVEYHPMPEGTMIEDAITGELTYGPSKSGDWLFYGVNSKAGLAQDDAFWAVGNPVQGMTVVHNPTGPVSWPFGHKKGKIYYAIRDFSDPVVLNNQLFEAAGEGDGGKPINEEPNEPTTPPPVIPSAPIPTGFGLTGDLGPCPQGITTLGIVIQLDDASGFDWLRGKSAESLTEMGADSVVQIKTEDISTEFKYDPDKLAQLLRNSVRNVDCECSEVVITVISHGNAKSDGTHELISKDRYKSRRQDKIVAKKTKINTAEFLELIAKAFHDEVKDCLAVTTLMQPCYSGAVLDEVEDAVKKGAGDGRRNFRVMTASAADQPAYGDWDGEGGEPDIYFLEALRACLKNMMFDANSDGKVSLQEAWPCLLEEVWLRARTGSGKDQNPKKWPNP